MVGRPRLSDADIGQRSLARCGRVSWRARAHRGHSAWVTIDWSALKRAAAQRLLEWDNTAVIEDAATLLVLDSTVYSMALICEALMIQQAAEDFEAQETILWVLSPAWKSGRVDVPSLLREVRATGNEQAQGGAAIALEWLHIDT